MKAIYRTLFITIILFTSCKTGEKSRINNVKPDYEIKTGETFRISLTSNPSTGYSWSWTNKAAVTIVDTTGFTYTPDREGMIGGGGKEEWIFEAKKKGTDTVKLEYKRVWEKVPAVRTKEIIVRVK